MTLGPADVELSQEVREGWGVAAEGGTTVALDLAIAPELRMEGLAREIVRAVQDARKAAGLDVSDRIELGLETSGELAEAAAAHRSYIQQETLAVALADVSVGGNGEQTLDVEGHPLRITIRRSREDGG